MVIGSSALLAILLQEPDARSYADGIEAGSPCLLSAATLVETSIVLEGRRGEQAGRELDVFLDRAGIRIVSVDARRAEIARLAVRRFGKGRHPAGLNFGDCFAYALAMATGEPLLSKGVDFAATDLTSC